MSTAEMHARNRTIRETWDGVGCSLNGAQARVIDYGGDRACIISDSDATEFRWSVVDRTMRTTGQFRTF